MGIVLVALAAWLALRGVAGDPGDAGAAAGADVAPSGTGEIEVELATPVEAGPEPEAEGQGRHLAPPAGVAGRTLTVAIVDPDGEPVTGFHLTLLAGTFDPRDVDAERLVDGAAVDGELRLPIDDDLRLILATGWAGGYAPVSHGFGIGADPAPAVELVLVPAASARLRAVDVDGAPVVGTNLTIEPADGAGATARWTRGAGPGEELVHSEADGRFDLRVAKDGVGSASLAVDLRVGHSLDLGDVVLRPGPRVRGRVALADGAPVPGVEVVAVEPDASRWGRVTFGSAITDARGEFEFTATEPAPLEIRVTQRFDPDGTTWGVLEPGEDWIDLRSPALLAVVRAGDPAGAAPLGKVRFSGVAVDIPYDQRTGRWNVAGFTRDAEGATELRLLMPPEAPWQIVAEAVAGEPGCPESVGELEGDGLSRVVSVDLVPFAAPADTSIEVRVTRADGIGPDVSVSLGSTDTGLARSAVVAPGEPHRFDGLRAGRYQLSAHADFSGATEFDRSLVVSPRWIQLDLTAGGHAQVDLHLTRGARLVVDLSGFPAGDGGFAHTAGVSLESDRGELHPTDASPYFLRLDEEDRPLRNDGADFLRFGHRWQSSEVIAPGLYRVTVRPNGYRAWNGTIELHPGQTAEIRPSAVVAGD